MFIQAFVFIVSVIMMVMGVKDADYLLLVLGLLGTLSGVHLVYQVKTGKSLLETWGKGWPKSQGS